MQLFSFFVVVEGVHYFTGERVEGDHVEDGHQADAHIAQVPHYGVGLQAADEQHDQSNQLVHGLAPPVATFAALISSAIFIAIILRILLLFKRSINKAQVRKVTINGADFFAPA